MRFLKVLSLLVGLSFFAIACGGESGGGGPVAKSWGTAELIETDNAGSAFLPQVATGSNAIAVWEQFDVVARRNIWANRFVSGTWGTAELIETDDTGDAGDPQVAVDSSGNAIAVWRQHDGTRDNIWANQFN